MKSGGVPSQGVAGFLSLKVGTDAMDRGPAVRRPVGQARLSVSRPITAPASRDATAIGGQSVAVPRGLRRPELGHVWLRSAWKGVVRAGVSEHLDPPSQLGQGACEAFGHAVVGPV